MGVFCSCGRFFVLSRVLHRIIKSMFSKVYMYVCVCVRVYECMNVCRFSYSVEWSSLAAIHTSGKANIEEATISTIPMCVCVCCTYDQPASGEHNNVPCSRGKIQMGAHSARSRHTLANNNGSNQYKNGDYRARFLPSFSGGYDTWGKGVPPDRSGFALKQHRVRFFLLFFNYCCRAYCYTCTHVVATYDEWSRSCTWW